jgi:hypothetical protein
MAKKISTEDRIWLARVWSAIAVLAGGTYCLVHWMGRPTSGTGIAVGLAGFAIVGVAPWIAPFPHRWTRVAARVAGSFLSLSAVGVFAFLVYVFRDL